MFKMSCVSCDPSPAPLCTIHVQDLSSPLQNFEALQLDEIKQSIAVRRNRIFLLMEEVRRLRIQQRLKVGCLPARTAYQEEWADLCVLNCTGTGCLRWVGSEPPYVLLRRSMLHIAG